jgi:hypothetical protein
MAQTQGGPLVLLDELVLSVYGRPDLTRGEIAEVINRLRSTVGAGLADFELLGVRVVAR